MALAVRHEHGAFSEAIDDDTGEGIAEAKLHLLRRAGEHAEDGFSVAGQIELPCLLGDDAGLIGNGKFCHLVDAVVRQPVALGVGNQVIVFVVPDQRVGTGKILARTLVFAPVHAPVKIAEANLFVFRDCFMYPVDGIVDAFVHRLDAVADGDLPFELRRLIAAAKRRELFNQRDGFALG